MLLVLGDLAVAEEGRGGQLGLVALRLARAQHLASCPEDVAAAAAWWLQHPGENFFAY